MTHNRSLSHLMVRSCPCSCSQLYQSLSHKRSCHLYPIHLRLHKLLVMVVRSDIHLWSSRVRKWCCHRSNRSFKCKRHLGSYMIWQGQVLSIQCCTKFINSFPNAPNTNPYGKRHQRSNNKISTWDQTQNVPNNPQANWCTSTQPYNHLINRTT